MAFGLLKQNFPVGQFVRIGQTTSPELDGMICRVLGTANSTPECDFYIVAFSKALSFTDDVAGVIIESCLEPADDVECRRMGAAGTGPLGSDGQRRAFP